MVHVRFRWVWFCSLVLAIALIVFTLHGGDRPFSPTSAATDTPNIPSINSDRLWADVEALSFPRFSPDNRQKALDYIERSLNQAGWETTRLPFEQGINLVAKYPNLSTAADPGDRPQILLGAHYDTVPNSPGADDNATGIAVLLEIARQWGAHPITQPPILAFFDLEEAGLLGSVALANDPEQRDRIDGAIILDMVGYTCTAPGCQTYPDLSALGPIAESLPDQGNFLAAIGDRRQPLLDSFASPPALADLRLPPLLPISVPNSVLPDLARSDHAAFWNVDITAVLLTDTANFRNPHYHQPSDRPDTLDRAFLDGSAQHILYALYALLNPS